MEKKQKRRPDIREVIVDAARELFSKKGYHNTQVSDIIRLVGMSANTFYAHFKDKKELFEDAPIDRGNATIKNHGQKYTLRLIKELAQKQNVTLMCHCGEDERRCHRHVLKKILLSRMI